jgi:hypothetical protein
MSTTCGIGTALLACSCVFNFSGAKFHTIYSIRLPHDVLLFAGNGGTWRCALSCAARAVRATGAICLSVHANEIDGRTEESPLALEVGYALHVAASFVIHCL